MAKLKRPKIGLALGSGGPRGLAHIGVIKVLKENNIPIDFIAGSSIGAMVGGFYAATKDIGQVEKIALGTNWKMILALIDPSFRQGLLGGKKVNNFIEDHIDKMDFKDLKVPLSVVATNFKNGDAVVINKGDVASAIRASISLPLVFRPVEREGKLLVDGGLSLPVPVEVVRKMGADLVIAVNLDADYFADNNSENNKFGFYKMAENSINLLRHHLAYRNVENADIVISPRVGNAHWGKFLDGKDIISAGEKATKIKLSQLKESIHRENKDVLSKFLDFLKL
ncbi:MAG TPA: patatin-like phospholipase family protein [Candidatus Moranbacteria bacterium]|jgi:NTE family protein|nr:patatin-like phospholipase family protein [Candidatus Moranbacteria bacterium]